MSHTPEEKKELFIGGHSVTHPYATGIWIEENKRFAEVYGDTIDQSKTNAKRVVDCLNSYDDLCYALKDIVDEWTINNGRDKEEFKTFSNDIINSHSYWSPSACMVSAEFISKARTVLNKALGIK